MAERRPTGHSLEISPWCNDEWSIRRVRPVTLQIPLGELVQVSWQDVLIRSGRPANRATCRVAACGSSTGLFVRAHMRWPLPACRWSLGAGFGGSVLVVCGFPVVGLVLERCDL